MSVPRTAFMRDRAERFLTDRCTIRRAGASVRDAQGGSTTTYTDETGVPCTVFPTGGEATESLVGARLAGISEHVVSLKHDTTIGIRDRIVWQGRVYNVTGIRHRSDGILLLVGVKGVS